MRSRARRPAIVGEGRVCGLRAGRWGEGALRVRGGVVLHVLLVVRLGAARESGRVGDGRGLMARSKRARE